VTFSEDAITDIQVVEHGETRNIADAAIEAIPAAVLESQSIAVDAISSVTFTSRGLLNAIQDACEQAGGNMELLKQKPAAAEPVDEELTTDVVVVGMGLAGVAASLSALDEGAKVVSIAKVRADDSAAIDRELSAEELPVEELPADEAEIVAEETEATEE